MLKTLDNYIDDRQAPSGLLESIRARAKRDPRFNRLLALSLVAHLIFYTAVIKLDLWNIQRAIARVRRQPTLVQLTELAPPREPVNLRSAPEPLERADLNRLHFDPDDANDLQLLNRSPKPSHQRGAQDKLPSADQIERRVRAMRGRGDRDSQTPPKKGARPPASSLLQASGIAQPEAPPIAQPPSPQPVPAPPAASAKLDPAPAAAGARDQTSAGTLRGESTQSTALALQAAEGQYMAYVRAKIRKANERIMPRDWIKDMLRDKVSADFTVIIRRDGNILSTRLVRSTGFSVLDDSARQAIFTASPYEGYPQDAGTSLIFTVTVYFFTL
ncbi:MAG: TonB C-terminal domain-containing protein [Blastocatellia bacterium]